MSRKIPVRPRNKSIKSKAIKEASQVPPNEQPNGHAG
jgi:hypothetical protein